jgi:hypothetical protein
MSGAVWTNACRILLFYVEMYPREKQSGLRPKIRGGIIMWMVIGLISLIVFLVGLVLFLVKVFKKDAEYKKWGIITLVFFVLFAVSVSSDNNTTSPASAKKAPAPAIVAKPAFDWAKAPITEVNVKSALVVNNSVNPIFKDSDFPKDIKSVRVDKGNITITYKPGEMLDETDFIKCCGGTVIVAGSKLFQNPNVSMITLVAQVDFRDTYGKTTIEPGCTIDIDKATAQQADWKGLAQMHITNPANIYNILPSYFIYLGVYKDINDDLKSKIPNVKWAN